jgi:hypothetical protein
MRRALNTLIFFCLGLLSLYASLRLLGQLDLPAMFPGRTANGCWEIDHCRIPFWYWCVAGALLALPLAFFVRAGFSLRAGRVFRLATAGKVIALFCATLVFLAAVDVLVFLMKTM